MQSPSEAFEGRFDQRLDDILARTSYFRAESGADRETIYRLRYDAYLREGTIAARDDLRFCDDYDRNPNAIVFGVNIDGSLAGSIRLHVTSAASPWGPALDTYGDVLGPILKNGESCIDPSRFVTSPVARAGAKLLPFAVTRLACMAAEYFDVDWMLATVRLEHAAFYRRFCRLKPLAAPRDYPCLTKQLMLLGERNQDIRDSVFGKYPVFSSTAAERLALFATANDMHPAIAFPQNDNQMPQPIHVA